MLHGDLQVTIYRLLSKSTYEENVFQISSRKYGEARGWAQWARGGSQGVQPPRAVVAN